MYFSIVGHRGAAGLAPENTIPSFEEAKKYDVDFIEMDVRVTRDGYLVVIHDATVDRTTNGSGLVSNMSLDQIKRLDAGSWFSDRYRGAKIPTLAEALEVLSDGDFGIIIELKERNIEKKTVETIEESGLMDRTIIASFDMDTLANIRNINDNIPLLAISVRYNDRIIERILKLGIRILALRKDIINKHVAHKCRIRGIILNAWTVNDVDLALRLVRIGVDIISTDYPNRMCMLRKRLLKYKL